MRAPGAARVDLVGRYAQAGMSRLVAFPTRWDPTSEAQALFAADCKAAGMKLGA